MSRGSERRERRCIEVARICFAELAVQNLHHASDHRRERYGQRSARALDSRTRQRRDAPFLKIDCASLPAELVESELFGHERGAFTGAVVRKPGRLEMAQGGTIVLDEIAALSPGMQAKLLRVLEERTFERLGGTETLRMEARLMALTNTDLPKAVAAGRFREDLFLSPKCARCSRSAAAERRADISPLVSHFLARLGPVHGRADATLDPAALYLLESYAWPGNVRELKNAIEHALVFGKASLLEPDDFPEIVSATAGGPWIERGAPLAGRSGTRRDQGDARSHTLQDRPRRRNSGH